MDYRSEVPIAQHRKAGTHFCGLSFRQWFVSYFLVALVWFGVDAYQRVQKQREEYARLNQAAEEAGDAVRRGEGGEALNFLFAKEHEQF